MAYKKPHPSRMDGVSRRLLTAGKVLRNYK